MANGLPDPPCGLLTDDSARSLVDSVDAFLFDCDGLRFVTLPSFHSYFFFGFFPCDFAPCFILIAIPVASYGFVSSRGHLEGG